MRHGMGHLVDDGVTDMPSRRTTAALSTLPADRWTVLYDVAWPGRRRAVIDQVVVGPAGVFVVTSRSWPGRVTLEAGVLREAGRNRIGALRGAVAAAAAVASVWPEISPVPVHAVLCLTGGDSPTASLGCVSVCSTRTLTAMLASMPLSVTGDQVRIVVSDLRWLLRGVGEPADLTPAGALRSPERSSALR